MLSFESQSQEPSAPATLPKNAAVNRANLPETPCDLEFRPQIPHLWHRYFRTAAWIVLAAALSLPISAIVKGGFSSFMLNRPCFMLALTAGCLLSLWRLSLAQPKQDAAPVFWFFGPIWTWTVLAFMSSAKSLGLSWFFMVFGAMPILVLVADQIATHAVYWMSANPVNEFSVRDSVRSQWSQRFTASADAGATQRYRISLALLIPCFLTSAALTVTLFDQPQVSQMQGTAFLLILSTTLFGVGSFRAGLSLTSLSLVWRFLCHWLNYGADVNYPQYVFQSPCGSPLRRQILLLLAVFVSSAAIFTLTHSFFWAIDWQSPRTWEMTVVRAFAVVAKVICLIALNVLMQAVVWFLGLFFLVGPVLSFHFNTLEKPNAFSN